MLVLVASGGPNELVPEAEPTTVAGELVIPIESCACDELCRCRRSSFGIASGGVTPTAVIADRAGVEPADLRQVVAEHIQRTAGADERIAIDVEFAEMVAAEVDAVLEQLQMITATFPDGTELARVGDHVTEVCPVDPD